MLQVRKLQPDFSSTPAHAAGESAVQAGPIRTLPPVHKAVHDAVCYACLAAQLLTWTGTSPQLGPSSMA
jgi:hypothetical protein